MLSEYSNKYISLFNTPPNKLMGAFLFLNKKIKIQQYLLNYYIIHSHTCRGKVSMMCIISQYIYIYK